MKSKPETNATRWWWVRHAPIVGYTGQIFGQTDADCDLANQAAIDGLASALPQKALWITTHLKRTAKTANAIAKASGIAMTPNIIPDLAEQSFGTWEGLDWNGIHEKDKARHDTFWQDPFKNVPPQGESLQTFMTRCHQTINDLNTTFAGKDIIAVTHAGTIRSAVALALSLSPEKMMALQVDNLSLTRLDHIAGTTLNGHGGHWRVVGVNQVP